MNQVHVHSLFHEPTSTFTHIVYDHPQGKAAVIDPVLDYEANSGRTHTQQLELTIAFLREQQLELVWILETHAHADHLSGAQILKQKQGGTVAIGEHISTVQSYFGKVFDIPTEEMEKGISFDHLFADGEAFDIGLLQGQALHVPGHTPADMAYLIGDALFVGDTLFMPDVGTARCDFPGGDAATLYRSIQRLYSLPDSTRVFMCHDYPPASRQQVQAVTTLTEEKQHNIHLRAETSEADFIARRQARDAQLAVPNLLLPSIQVNVRGGHLPKAKANGTAYLQIPLNLI